MFLVLHFEQVTVTWECPKYVSQKVLCIRALNVLENRIVQKFAVNRILDTATGFRTQDSSVTLTSASL